MVVRGWHLLTLLLIKRGYPLLALPPAHGFSNSSARVTPTSTSIDRARVPPNSSIGKAKMTLANFTAIDYEEWLLVRVLRGQSTRSFFQMQNADEVTSGVDIFSSVGHISSVGLRVMAFWGELNSWFWNCSDEIVCRVRWPGHVTTSLQMPPLYDESSDKCVGRWWA